ncbi:hypothetical protein CPC08DRAFT_558379 [Agrocybe pediades]|nr:hypothetical protein CPC08DRAFT_558379 [Agrocybe pediades]
MDVSPLQCVVDFFVIFMMLRSTLTGHAAALGAQLSGCLYDVKLDASLRMGLRPIRCVVGFLLVVMMLRPTLFLGFAPIFNYRFVSAYSCQSDLIDC